MNRHLCSVLLLAASATPAIAQEPGPSRTLTTVEVQGALYVTECSHRVPPNQRQVGEWTGMYNLGEAYAARERLIADIDRVCRRPGIARARVLMEADDEHPADRRVAVVR